MIIGIDFDGKTIVRDYEQISIKYERIVINKTIDILNGNTN